MLTATTNQIKPVSKISSRSNVDMNNIRAAEKFQEEAGQIYTTIFHKYNIRVRPTDTYPNPVVVDVRVILWHIRNFDRLKQEIETLLELDIVSLFKCKYNFSAKKPLTHDAHKFTYIK